MPKDIKKVRGGHQTTAKTFEDTILDIREASLILKRSISRVRDEARTGELPVEGWSGDRPFFKAGKIMEIAGKK